MVKAKYTNDKGEPVVILGLSKGNCKKLLKGQPIHIQLADLGVETGGHVVIIGGETEQDITRELSNHFHLPS